MTSIPRAKAIYKFQSSFTSLNHCNIQSEFIISDVGPLLTEFRIDRMAFGQPERTCLNIQNVPLL